MSSLSRRAFLRTAAQWSVAGSIACTVAACGKTEVSRSNSAVCADPAQLSAGERSLRDAVHYTKTSENPEQVCNTCAFFKVDSAAPACGTCEILNGPVNRAGHCQSWSKRT